MRAMGERIAVVVAMATVVASAAQAAAPDSCQRAALQRRIGGLGEVRILGPTGPTLLHRPLVRDGGIYMGTFHAPRPALIVGGDLPAAPRPVERVAWSDIDSVQVRKGADAGSINQGLWIGALVDLAVTARFAQGAAEMGIPRELIFPLGAVQGGLVGALFGAGIQHWRTVYPRGRGERPLLPCDAEPPGVRR